MHFLAALLARHVAALDDLAHQVEPFALFDRLSYPVHARGPQRADRVALAPAVAMHKLLDGRFVSAIMAGRRRGMGLVERAVGENPFVDRARRNEHEPLDAG